jgi:hypothetical protein
MTNKFANRVFVTTATTGTGTITLGSPLAGYQSFTSGGIANADVVRYLLLDGSGWETGTGTYTASGTTLSRTPTASSNSNAALNLSGGAKVAVIASAEDYAAFLKGPTSAGDNHVALFDGTTDRLIKGVAQLPLAQGGTGASTAAAARTNLGLGTAATGTLTTSTTDDTAGRVMRAGDAGWLGQAIPPNAGISIDDSTLPTGLYRFEAAFSGGTVPVGSSAGMWLHMRRETGVRAHQIFYAQAAFDSFLRFWNGSVWSAWARNYDQRSILGTVSQAAGIPTGSVLQGNASATTPAGGYVERRANGFQIAHHTLTSSSSADTTWTYNTAFLAGSTPVISITPVGDVSYRVRLVSRTATAAVFSIRDGSDNRVAVPVDLMARGRWSDML